MRRTRTQNGFRVRAISGTHIVHLAFNVTAQRRTGLLGFAIKRLDRTDGEVKWLRNMRCFPGFEADADDWRTNEAPIQKFRWADYTAKPGRSYRYTAYAVTGAPGNLNLGTGVTVDIATEVSEAVTHPDGTVHQVAFNRGGAASQAYVEHFGDKSPDELNSGAAYSWLSRGLMEGMRAFIDRARDQRDELLVAAYEFHHKPILRRVKDAVDRGVTVRLLYDAGTGTSSPRAKNEAALDATGLRTLARARAGLGSRISHHKFMVLVQDGTPVSVWTGSTNFSINGLYAQLNVGHAVDHPALATAFRDLHAILWNDPGLSASRTATAALGPVLAAAGTTHHGIFSPRSNEEAMTFYLALMGQAQQFVVMTNPFGVDARIESFLAGPANVIKFGLLSTSGSDLGEVERLDSIDGTRFTMPARMKTVLDRWQREQFHFKSHAYIHTKFLLIDPLGDHPIVVTGSANFSRSSCIYNDENMLVIRDHKSLADIYLTEFLRLFEHYAFRHFIETAGGPGPGSLKADNSWTERYFVPGSERERDRVMFAGAI